jgi:hypothetical protein
MVPVILLGGLNVVRALGLAGIPVIVASQDRRAPSMASRFCSGTLQLPPLSERDAVGALVRRPCARRRSTARRCRFSTTTTTA